MYVHVQMYFRRNIYYMYMYVHVSVYIMHVVSVSLILPAISFYHAVVVSHYSQLLQY